MAKPKKPKKSTKKPTKKPATKKPAAKKPAAKKPAAKKPAAKKPRPRKPPPKPRAPSPGPPVEDMGDREAHLAQTARIRDDAWSAWGDLEPDVIAHLVNPTFMGGPRWPAMRQAYRVVTRGDEVLIASDGLADPFDPDFGPQDKNGIELEVFAITDEDIARPGVEGVARYGATWLHDLVFQCAHLAAQHGGLAGLLDELRAISTELYDVKIPEAHRARFVNEHGRVAVLLSLAPSPIPSYFAGPLSEFRFVHIQLLTLEELAFVLQGGEPARAELLAKLVAQGVYPRSRLDRPSVV